LAFKPAAFFIWVGSESPTAVCSLPMSAHHSFPQLVFFKVLSEKKSGVRLIVAALEHY
jgi:hypothetical protein